MMGGYFPLFTYALYSMAFSKRGVIPGVLRFEVDCIANSTSSNVDVVSELGP